MRSVWTCGLALLAGIDVAAPPGAAQETETERAAAADVVRQISELEASIDVPHLIARLAGRDAGRDAVIARVQQLWRDDLQTMADWITRHPETGFQETQAVEKLTAFLAAHDFEVTQGVAGLSTAFVGRYRHGTPGPNLGVILEYDALRGTKGAFHGDQHSAQGPVGMAVAIALAEFLTRSHTPGTVTVYGTPAEEMSPPDSKTQMWKAGVFNGADVIVRSHSSMYTSRSAPGFGTCCMNIDTVKYTFYGAPAHQLTAWNGRNALEAVKNSSTILTASAAISVPRRAFRASSRRAGPPPTWCRTRPPLIFISAIPIRCTSNR